MGGRTIVARNQRKYERQRRNKKASRKDFNQRMCMTCEREQNSLRTVTQNYEYFQENIKVNKKLFERCIKNKEEEPLCYRFNKGLSD